MNPDGSGPARPSDRFHDPGARLEDFFDEVLVRCPRCDARARVVPDRPDAPVPGRAHWLADRRLACSTCTLVRHWPDPGARRTCLTGTDVDPWFRLPLWLRIDVSGEVLWALNVRHLDLLEAYVTAGLRTRDRTPGSIHTLLNRLPTWIKQARHRPTVLAAIGRLRATL